MWATRHHKINNVWFQLTLGNPRLTVSLTVVGKISSIRSATSFLSAGIMFEWRYRIWRIVSTSPIQQVWSYNRCRINSLWVPSGTCGGSWTPGAISLLRKGCCMDRPIFLSSCFEDPRGTRLGIRDRVWEITGGAAAASHRPVWMAEDFPELRPESPWGAFDKCEFCLEGVRL